MAASRPATPRPRQALEQEAQRLAQRLGVAHLELRNVQPRHADWPRQDLYVTFRKAILPDEEANMLAIPRKQRAMVRKGIKNDLRSEIDAGRRPLLRAVCRQRAPPRHAGAAQALLPGAVREFGNDCEVLTVSAPDGQRAEQRAELLLPRRGAALLRRRRPGGARPGGQRLQVLGADAPRLRARHQGLRLRPQQAGHRPLCVQEELGLRADAAALRVPLYKRDAVPQNNPANAKFKLMIETWRRLPLGVANWLGP